MNTSTGIIIGVVALAVVAGGVYTSMNTSNDAMMVKDTMEDTTMMEQKAMAEKDAQMKDGAMQTDSMKKEETSMMDKGDTMMKAGSYEAYSAEKLARAETGDVVLFFHASWCPTCRGLNADIVSNLKSIPEGVTILKTDYDSETELKKKYGVTYQHTLVQVASDGTLITKWSGGGSLDTLLSKIQ